MTDLPTYKANSEPCRGPHEVEMPFPDHLVLWKPSDLIPAGGTVLSGPRRNLKVWTTRCRCCGETAATITEIKSPEQHLVQASQRFLALGHRGDGCFGLDLAGSQL